MLLQRPPKPLLAIARELGGAGEQSIDAIDLIVRGTGQGSRLMAMLGAMLITFFAALAAHYWVVHKLQGVLAPNGTPKISRIADRLNLTLQWLAAAAGVAAILTLAVASLTGLLFPMTPPANAAP